MTNETRVKAFSESLNGRLILPGADVYDAARSLWNGMIDRRPAMIARCNNVEDIVKAVHFARENGLTVSIKGGGHGVSGKAVCDDGLMIDLTNMKKVVVDPDARTARVEPGATLGVLDEATQAHGLATTGGLVSETGVAGLTLGGGLGYLARRFGLTIDNLISAELVTADGRRIRVSDAENPDLFWALRGGGGNFGVVTSFEYQLHPVGPEVLVAQIFYPIDAAGQVLGAYRQLMATAPDELACYALAVNIPPVDPFPEGFHGKGAIALVACYSGTEKAGMSLLEPVRNIGDPILEAVGPMPYTALQQSFDQGMPEGKRYYWKGHYVDGITDDAIEVFTRFANRIPGDFSMAGFEPMGGAISRVDQASTAFPERNAPFSLGIWAGWADPARDDEIIAWTREFYKAMEPYASGGVYTNYLDQDDDGKVRSVYGEKYARLQKIKGQYDPDNFFRLNQNIEPAT